MEKGEPSRLVAVCKDRGGFGVPPKPLRRYEINQDRVRRDADSVRNAFGETPKAARETRALPKTGRRHYPRNVATQFLELL